MYMNNYEKHGVRQNNSENNKTHGDIYIYILIYLYIYFHKMEVECQSVSNGRDK